MSLVLTVRGKTPLIPKSTYVAENASIIGDVSIGENCSVWFQAVIRGDVNKIQIGENVNIQDGAVIHCSYQKAATTIGKHVSVGHKAILHGCTIEDNVLVGMGAIVMDHAIVGKGAIIAAGAVVLEKTIVPPYTIYAGTPAKEVKKLTPDQAIKITQESADNYALYKSWYQ